MSRGLRRVLITGGGSGIGLACAEKFLEEGWHVTAHFFRTKGRLQQLKRSVAQSRLEMIYSDFRKENHVKHFLAYVKKASLDALVNNAGIYDMRTSGHDATKQGSKVFMVNAIVPALVTAAALDSMQKRRFGRIVQVSSISAKYGSPPAHLFYGMSKRALEGITKTYKQCAARFNVLINTVRAGATDTKFQSSIPGRDLRKRSASIPMGRMADAREVADLIYYLCGANTFITGQVIAIAGGE